MVNSDKIIILLVDRQQPPSELHLLGGYNGSVVYSIQQQHPVSMHPKGIKA